MKRIQIALAALLISTSFTIAQPGIGKQGKHPHFDKQEKAVNKLDLTEDQKTKINAANADFKTQMQALNNNDNQTVKQQRDAREALIKTHQAQVDAILSADQKNQLAEMRQNKTMHHGQADGKHLDRLQQELNLTDQQVSQLKSSQEATKAKIDAISNNTSLDAATKKQQRQALRTDMKNNMEQVLTPEQKEKWKGMMKNKKHAPRAKRGDDNTFNS